ncbi:hypothetical protein [Pseudodonghicola sp.]|uniref:hypothetical protein n=1 Tax=Pseudodonghicola sp. TaxID=1969463 RepID=UPI003A97C9BF
MSQIEELEGRITAAMARISVGLGALAERAGSQAVAEAGLAEALEEEKLANAQLEERLKHLKDRHAEEIAALEALIEAGAVEGEPADTEIEALRAEIAALQAELAAARIGAVPGDLEVLQAEVAHQAEMAARLDMDVQRLRKSNEQLREANAALREANEAGVGEPALINRAMLAELEGLRATRAAEAAEAGAILSRLEPLLSSARNMPEGEDE